MKPFFLMLLFLTSCLSKAQIVINEYSFLKGTQDIIGFESDWVEVFNTSDNVIDLSTYYLSDNIENPTKWNLPSINLNPNSRITFYCSGKDTVHFDNNNSSYHTNFKLSASENLSISTLNETIDSLVMDSNLYFGLSHGRANDGAESWCFFDTPSPNTSNNFSICYSGITPSPDISLESGWYAEMQTINFIAPSDSISIYYTLNGNIPDSNDNLFTTTLTIDANTIISYRAFSNGNLPSKISDRTYIFEEDNHDLKVFSIHTDPENLWDYFDGIYVSGPNPSVDYPYFGSNFWQPWSKFSRIEFFNSNKIKEGEEHLDLEIHGGWSRAEPQKSFRLDFKSKYTGRIEYPIFDSKQNISSFNNLNLRNGGQHTWSDKIQDAVFSTVASKTYVNYMAYEPCIVYLNGEYWGVYGAREKIDEHYVSDNFLIESSLVDLMNSFTVLNGTSEAINTSFDYLMNEDVNSETFYQAFTHRFNIQNYIDYFVIQTYIQNMDWIGIAWGANNIKLWRPQAENGKIHYVLYDTDGSFSYFSGSEWDNYLQYAMTPANPNIHSELFNKVLQNEQFRCEFSSRYADLINTVFRTDSFNTTVDTIKSELLPAMQDHVDRWIDASSIYGTLQSVSQWENAVNQIKYYNSLRVDPALYLVNETLDLNGSTEVTLNVEPLQTGKIQLNTIIPDTYPWNGTYFNECAIELIAKPNDGYEFIYWTDADNNQYNNDTIQFNLNELNNFTAHYEACEDILSLNIIYQDDAIISNIISGANDYSLLWFLNDNPLVQDSIISMPIPGNYQLELSTQNCKLLSNIITIEEPVSLNENISTIDNLYIYPNPSNGLMNIELNLLNSSYLQLSITNYLGEIVFTDEITNQKDRYNKTIDLRNKAKGVYMINITTNNRNISQKIVIK